MKYHVQDTVAHATLDRAAANRAVRTHLRPLVAQHAEDYASALAGTGGHEFYCLEVGIALYPLLPANTRRILSALPTSDRLVALERLGATHTLPTFEELFA